MNFLDGYYETMSKMRSRAARAEFCLALVEFYYEGAEPEFKTEAAGVGFAGVRYSIAKARAGYLGGKGGGKEANQTPTKPEANVLPNAKESRTKEKEEEI